MPDIFDEVEEDLRAERARAFGRQFAGAGVAAIVLILAGTGGYVYWQESRAAAAAAVASRFIAAAAQADHAAAAPDAASPSGQAAGATQSFAAIAQAGPAGYRVLARLRLAALQWQAGQHTQANATWQALADDTAAPQLLRDLATLTSAQHQLDSADPVPMKQRLRALTGTGNPWRPLAEQLLALLDVRTGNAREAASLLQRLTVDPGAPDTMRQMATDLLTTLPPEALAPVPAKPAPAPAAHAAAAHG